MNPTIQRALAFLIFGALLAGRALAQDAREVQIEATRVAYAAATWPQGPRVDGVPLSALELPGLRATTPRTDGTFVQQSFVGVDAPAGARTSLLLEARVCDDVTTAHEALVDWLASRQSTVPAPRVEVFGATLGEVGYVVSGVSGELREPTVSLVAFVRGNVAVRVRNVDPLGAPELDVLAAAKAIDAAIAARPKLEPDANPASPDVATLAASTTTVAAGASPRLDVLVVDPAGGVPTLVWNVGGEGQGYVERRDDGWHLFTTAPGRLEVRLVAISSLGTLAERTLAFDVTPE